VHSSAIERLDPVLRLFEGCARHYVGRVDGANIVKLHRDHPMISYLSYPDFEDDPHPSLASSLTVHLQTFKIRLRDYSNSTNPPILHRKEEFLTEFDPNRKKFERMTRIEEAHGLYEQPARIGFKTYWESLLAEKRLVYRGHRLIKRKI